MKSHQGIFCVEQMAKVLGVSRSGYYDFLKRPQSKRTQENEKLTYHIHRVFKESQETYGSPRIRAELASEGLSVSRQRVARLMRKEGLKAKMYQKFVTTTNRSKTAQESPKDLLERQFKITSPNRVWVADITYIKVAQKWTYLAVVLDLFSRKIVGMALEQSLKTDLILKALQAALVHRKPPKGLIHHSDLGSQYTSGDMKKIARNHGIKLSYGNSAYDNAVMESFFHTLKTEQVYFQKYTALEEARLDIFTYIFTFYNSKRRHSTLNYQSPDTVEKNYKNSNQNIYVHSVQ